MVVVVVVDAVEVRVVVVTEVVENDSVVDTSDGTYVKKED